MKLSERLRHWENLSPSEFVVIRKEVAKLERRATVAQRVIAAYDAWPGEGYGDLMDAKEALKELDA